MKKIVLLLLILAVLAVFHAEAAEQRKCRQVRRCVKSSLKCIKSKRVKRCAKFSTYQKPIVKRRRTCIKLGPKPRGKNACRRCAKYRVQRVVRVAKKTACCKRFVTKRVCLKHKTVCAKKQLIKRCKVVKRKFKLKGPFKCPEGHVLQFKKLRGTILRTCVKTERKYTMRQCASYLDPHTKGFDGKNFEFQFEGDFLMAKTSDGVFAVHQRNKRFGGYTGSIGMAVLINGRDVVEFASPNTITLNKKVITVENNKPIHLRQGGWIVKKGNDFEVFSPNGASVVFKVSGNQGNIYVNVPSDLKVVGYCNGGESIAKYSKNFATGLFFTKMTVKTATGAAPKIKVTAAQRKNATIRCKAAGFKGAKLKICVHDVTVAKVGDKARVIKILKQERANEKKFKTVRVKKAWRKVAKRISIKKILKRF